MSDVLETTNIEIPEEQVVEYSVYARPNENNKVDKIFSTYFEEPLATDVLIKTGSGDEFIHVGYYEIYTVLGAHKYKIVDGVLTECTEEEMVAEIAAIAEAKREIYSADLNEIQSISGGKLTNAGWYRIAKYTGGEGSAFANSCEISIKRTSENTENEYHNFKLVSVDSIHEFQSITDRCKSQRITKARYTYTDNAGYIEVYYNGTAAEGVHITIDDAKDYSYRWRAINPEATEETVEDATIACQYDIPTNATPVTDLNTVKRVDLAGQLQTRDFTRSIIALCETNGASEYSLNSMSSGTIYIHRHNGLKETESMVDVFMSANLISDHNVNCAIHQSNNSDEIIKPCTFTYNGKIYGGIDIYLNQSYSSFIEFNGTTNFDIFGLDYYDERNKVALNEEIANSIDYNIYNLMPLSINGEKVATHKDLLNLAINEKNFSDLDTMVEYLNSIHMNAKDSSVYQDIISAPAIDYELRASRYTIHGYRLNANHGYQMAIIGPQKIWIRNIISGTWTKWTNLFTTDGGVLDGSLWIYKDGEEEVRYELQNSKRHVSFTVGKDGSYGIYEVGTGWLLYSDVDGNRYFQGTATGNLPLYGGTVDSLMTKIHPTEITLGVQGNTYDFGLVNTDATWSSLTIKNKNTKDAASFGYNNLFELFYQKYSEGNPAQQHLILHTGNKPTGTYTGNGSATERIINTGGIGRAIIIHGGSGNMAIITPDGAIVSNGTTISPLPMSQCTFFDGTLTLKTSNSVINANGVEYGYSVL